jgi:hypothetical protein
MTDLLQQAISCDDGGHAAIVIPTALSCRMAARLPMSPEEHYAARSLNQETAQLIDLLVEDKWFESEGGLITAAHDIFADAIIAGYIFDASGAITNRVGDVVDDALGARAFKRALLALNRLAGHGRFQDIDGLAVLMRAQARDLPKFWTRMNCF